MHDDITKIVHNLLSHLPDKPLKLWPWNFFQTLIIIKSELFWVFLKSDKNWQLIGKQLYE